MGALAWMIFYQANGMINDICNLQHRSLRERKNSDFGGYCAGRNPKTWNLSNVQFQAFISNIAYMLSVLVYFALNEPHDCYVCLGKDPDRIYSSF